MKKYDKCPLCVMVECFACEQNHCVILTNNEFGYRSCPFFKTKEQVAEEKAYCENRLAEIRIKNEEEK